MRSFIQILTALPGAIRVARRLTARHFAVVVKAPLPTLAYRQPVLLPCRQHDPQHMNRREPIAARARPRSHAA